MATKNSLYLRLTDTAGYVTLQSPVPSQVLILKAASVNFSTNALALANPVIFFDVDWLDANQLHSNVDTGYRLPLLTQVPVGGVTSYNPDIAMSIHKAIPEYFPYRITDVDGALIADSVVTEVHLLFEFDIGVI